jgi:hypothetical protein
MAKVAKAPVAEVEKAAKVKKEKAGLPQNVQLAKEAYEQARVQINLAIKNNQKAMHEFRSFGSPDHKKAYDETREAHKLALANIREVRANYYKLLDEHHDTLDA